MSNSKHRPLRRPLVRSEQHSAKMITVNSIKTQIAEISEEIQSAGKNGAPDMKKATETRLRKRVAFLRHCIMYVESNPLDQFVLKEIKRVENRIDKILENAPSTMYRQSRREYEKLNDIPKLRLQLKTLRFFMVNSEQTDKRSVATEV